MQRPKEEDLGLVKKLRDAVMQEYGKMKNEVEVGEVSIVTALVDEDIEKLVLLALQKAERPLSWREIKAVFAGVVGEDRLRRILGSLKARNMVAELTHTRYFLPEYVPLSEISRIKNPGIINKVLQLSRRR
ncbi:MAG: hypothetical protein QXM56_00540 [Acidilobaceae archaeon]